MEEAACDSDCWPNSFPSVTIHFHGGTTHSLYDPVPWRYDPFPLLHDPYPWCTIISISLRYDPFPWCTSHFPDVGSISLEVRFISLKVRSIYLEIRPISPKVRSISEFCPKSPSIFSFDNETISLRHNDEKTNSSLRYILVFFVYEIEYYSAWSRWVNFPSIILSLTFPPDDLTHFFNPDFVFYWLLSSYVYKKAYKVGHNWALVHWGKYSLKNRSPVVHDIWNIQIRKKSVFKMLIPTFSSQRGHMS